MSEQERPSLKDPTAFCWCCDDSAVPDRFYDGAYCQRCWDEDCATSHHLRGEVERLRKCDAASRRLYELARDGYAEVQAERDELKDGLKRSQEAVLGAAEENAALRAEVQRLEAEVERWKQASVANLLAKVTMPSEERDRLLAERQDARHLAEQWREVGETQLGATHRLVMERDEARDAAEHLWFHGEEHGVSHEEAREWYPWLYELHEQKQAARRREPS